MNDDYIIFLLKSNITFFIHHVNEILIRILFII